MADYDVIIVGSGHAGAFLAYQLGMRHKRVLVIEAGPAPPRSREDYMETFFLSTFKAPEAPFPPDASQSRPAQTNVPRPTIKALLEGWNKPDVSYLTYTAGSLPFASTYERIAGGTGVHWTGTSMRMLPNDFRMKTEYGRGRDWPLPYSEIEKHYADAEAFLGVSANVADQIRSGNTFPAGAHYPMPGFPLSRVDQYFVQKLDGKPPLAEHEAYTINEVRVTSTPVARNSVPYDNRRVCHGNTNCTPFCPIQAKYDAAWGLGKALATGYVDIAYQNVVDRVLIDEKAHVSGVRCVQYDDIAVPAQTGQRGVKVYTATTYVLAANAIESAKILLNSPWKDGITAANSSNQVGRNLMDHPSFLAWGLFPEGTPAHGYRGPMSTAGIETFRDGAFRRQRAAWRIEIGNDGWSWPTGDPYTTGLDYLYGTNNGDLNRTFHVQANKTLLKSLNSFLTRQFRVAFLVEQLPDPKNRIELSRKHTDHLGLPRPELTYTVDAYTAEGFVSAASAAKVLMERLGATPYTRFQPGMPTRFSHRGFDFNYQGAGHVSGTHIMGSSSQNSVVDKDQRSWDHRNLFLVGLGSMPSLGSVNPTLTLLAMAGRTVSAIMTG